VSQWTDWESVRHQVAVAGRVVDAEDKPVAGAQVTLTMLPEKPRQNRGGARSDQQEPDARCDRTLTKADGIFFFLDSLPGKYSVECVNGRSGLQDKKTVSVSRKQDGTVVRAVADLKLSKAEGRRQ
jgi:hypothetical protein